MISDNSFRVYLELWTEIFATRFDWPTLLVAIPPLNWQLPLFTHRPGPLDIPSCFGQCTVTSCSTCYYSKETRPLPSGCRTCGGPVDLSDRKDYWCFKRWARCIHSKDLYVYGEVCLTRSTLSSLPPSLPSHLPPSLPPCLFFVCFTLIPWCLLSCIHSPALNVSPRRSSSATVILAPSGGELLQQRTWNCSCIQDTGHHSSIN